MAFSGAAAFGRGRTAGVTDFGREAVALAGRREMRVKDCRQRRPAVNPGPGPEAGIVCGRRNSRRGLVAKRSLNVTKWSHIPAEGVAERAPERLRSGFSSTLRYPARLC